VAALLQVESPEQAARDPLLGGMFENMVVVELIKASRTFSQDILRAIRRFKDLVPTAGNGFVIYGGSDSFAGTDYDIRGFADSYRAIL